MKLLFNTLLLLFIIELISISCANPMSPTGGIKDTIPPTLIESNPIDQQLNFKGKSITLTFDETINSDKLQSNLIITPTTETSYKTLQKKYTVTLQFEEDFEDSTTYTLNFFDGITDITEKNPANNLILAFSTGTYIDSLYISGNVTDLLTGEPHEKVTVGLYSLSDTLDFESVKPTYFSTTTKDGEYFLQNIKASNYRLFAFADDNRNLLFDAATESYAIFPDTLNMGAVSGDTLHLNTIQINASSLDFISARPTGKYFEVRYTKPITHYTLNNADSILLASKLVDENKTIRIYDNKSFTDSLFCIIDVMDSLGNTAQDTTYIQYRESSRKSETYAFELKPDKTKPISGSTKYQLAFNKPSILVIDDFINVVYDTILTLDYKPYNIVYSDHNQSITFDLDLKQKVYQDSLQTLINHIVIDTANIDSAAFELKQSLSSISPKGVTLQVLPGSFLSVENDTSEVLKQSYQFVNTQSLGVIRVTLTTSYTHYEVQIMNNNTVISSLNNCQECVFTELKPGNYWVRILLDLNENGAWDVGNYRENIAPEPVFHFKEETTLRANFDNQLEYTF